MVSPIAELRSGVFPAHRSLRDHYPELTPYSTKGERFVFLVFSDPPLSFPSQIDPANQTKLGAARGGSPSGAFGADMPADAERGSRLYYGVHRGLDLIGVEGPFFLELDARTRSISKLS
jgi:hypothetical protein